MTTTDTIQWLMLAVHSGVIVYLCFERDRLVKRIKELESK